MYNYRVTSSHFPYFAQDRQDATTNNSHCFTKIPQGRPQCGFINRSPYTLQHLCYNYSTASLPQLSYTSPTTLPQLDLIRCRYSKHFTYIDIKLISAISAVIGSTYIDNHVWIQDADMLSLFKYIRGWIQRKCFKVHI